MAPHRYLALRTYTVISCSDHGMQMSPASACHSPNTVTCMSLMPVFVGSAQGIMLVAGSGEFRTFEEHDFAVKSVIICELIPLFKLWATIAQSV